MRTGKFEPKIKRLDYKDDKACFLSLHFYVTIVAKKLLLCPFTFLI